MSHEDDTCPHLVRANLLEAENARLKAEVESVRKYWKATGEGVNRYVGKSIALEDEVARLKAEVERLTAFTTRTIIPNEELQAQVERLTKAGDRLSAFLISCTVESRISQSYLNKLDNDWLAAKEGKQS
ncbi:MAG: hypothetical protein RI910_1991 [Verrucomicrobiota bacterium]|jgi:uncharacterized small protein (DUF1192 family)